MIADSVKEQEKKISLLIEYLESENMKDDMIQELARVNDEVNYLRDLWDKIRPDSPQEIPPPPPPPARNFGAPVNK